MSGNTQKRNSIHGEGNKILGGNDNSTNTTNNYSTGQDSSLKVLFEKLRQEFDSNERAQEISEELKNHMNPRDIIGLERKLRDAGLAYQVEHFTRFKHEFYKKLEEYKHYESAQEIFTYILAIILDRYTTLLRPMIADKVKLSDVQRELQLQIVEPILRMIREEGCEDLIGLSSTDIQGMFHYLTGNCHINWVIE